jgi:hypothetical protein
MALSHYELPHLTVKSWKKIKIKIKIKVASRKKNNVLD